MNRYHIHRRTGALDWSAAAPLTAFTFPWEESIAPFTEFRALWDDERLHFRFACVDRDLVLAGGDTPRDRVLGSDRVELFLAPDLTLAPYFCLEISPRGDVAAYRAEYYRHIDWSWRCEGLAIDARIDGERYTVWGSIPLATLRALGVLGRESFAGLYRAEFSHAPDGSIHQGWMPWVDPHTERPDFHVPASFGVFEWVDHSRRPSETGGQ